MPNELKLRDLLSSTRLPSALLSRAGVPPVLTDGAPVPSDCVAVDFSSSWYKRWSERIGFPIGNHAKFWEQAAIMEALDGRGCLKPGSRGLGMGVGQEQLVSAAASFECDVVATDQDPEADKARQWDNGQLAASRDMLHYEHIVPKEVFDRRVTYEHYDMNDDEARYRNSFDFIWHNCVIGHLGSMDKSIAHLQRSAEYLKEGGWLIFTTEVNISSLEHTVFDNSDTIVWRLKDIARLHELLAEVGLRSDGLALRFGDGDPDMKVDFDPVSGVEAAARLDSPDYYESKIVFSNYALTQVLLCYQKTTPKPKLLRAIDHRRELLLNTHRLRQHIAENSDLQDYYLSEMELDAAPVMEPVERQLKLVMSPGEEKAVTLSFTLLSDTRVFEYGLIHPYNSQPMIVATASPMNHEGLFKTDEWFGGNRPAVGFSSVTRGGQPTKYRHKAHRGEVFSYTFPVRAPQEVGTHTESYCLVQEGVQDFADTTTVALEIEVVSETEQP